MGSSVVQLRVTGSHARLPPLRAAVHPPVGAAPGARAFWVKAQISEAIPSQQEVSDKALKLMRSLLDERDGTWASSADQLLVRGAEDRRGHVNRNLKVSDFVDAWVTMLRSGRFQDHVVKAARDTRVSQAAPKADVTVPHASCLAREEGCCEAHMSDETAADLCADLHEIYKNNVSNLLVRPREGGMSLPYERVFDPECDEVARFVLGHLSSVVRSERGTRHGYLLTHQWS